jgi:hypothetical protein
MITPRSRVTLFMVALFIGILACGLPSNSPTEEPETATAAPGGQPDVAPTEAAVEPPSIQHTTIPVNLPENQSGLAGDFDSSKVLETGSLIGGDRFTFGRFERPFNANTMDVYFSEIDITNTQVFQDDLWIYGRITLRDLGASSSQTARYAVELDTNVNGKAEWLIVADKPNSTDWTVSGVRVYQDANQDVGGEFPMLTDDPAVDGDGFETLFFDQGEGNNPDTAWVRISPADANVVEFAINRAALSNPTQYLINMWAGRDIDPSKFDLNDAYTHEQAGAADEGLEFYYPIKAVAEIDNSCRMAVGFQPNGSEPGICPVPQKEGGDPVPPGSSCPPGTFLFCSENGCFCFPIIILPPPPPPPG